MPHLDANAYPFIETWVCEWSTDIKIVFNLIAIWKKRNRYIKCYPLHIMNL